MYQRAITKLDYLGIWNSYFGLWNAQVAASLQTCSFHHSAMVWLLRRKRTLRIHTAIKEFRDYR